MYNSLKFNKVKEQRCDFFVWKRLETTEFSIFLAKKFSHIGGGGVRKSLASLESKIEAKLNALETKINKIDAKTEIDFFSKVSHLPRYSQRKQDRYSQIGQDLIVYIFHNAKKDGFYIDIGASDGIRFSNSLLFEELGWRGFCVEANPAMFEKLRKNRKCDCYNLAVFSENIGTTRMATTSWTGLNTLEVNLTDYQVQRMRYDGGRNEEIQFIEVKTTTFSELMDNYPDVHHIDFLSMDIEGGELEVLKGIDFDRYTFSLMAIEFHPVKGVDIPEFLKSKGYRILMYDCQDFIFVPDEHIDWESPYL